MSPTKKAGTILMNSAPRVSGDEPYRDFGHLEQLVCSPRERVSARTVL